MTRDEARAFWNAAMWVMRRPGRPQAHPAISPLRKGKTDAKAAQYLRMMADALDGGAKGGAE